MEYKDEYQETKRFVRLFAPRYYGEEELRSQWIPPLKPNAEYIWTKRYHNAIADNISSKQEQPLRYVKYSAAWLPFAPRHQSVHNVIDKWKKRSLKESGRLPQLRGEEHYLKTKTSPLIYLPGKPHNKDKVLNVEQYAIEVPGETMIKLCNYIPPKDEWAKGIEWATPSWEAFKTLFPPILEVIKHLRSFESWKASTMKTDLDDFKEDVTELIRTLFFDQFPTQSIEIQSVWAPYYPTKESVVFTILLAFSTLIRQALSEHSEETDDIFIFYIFDRNTLESNPFYKLLSSDVRITTAYKPMDKYKQIKNPDAISDLLSRIYTIAQVIALKFGVNEDSPDYGHEFALCTSQTALPHWNNFITKLINADKMGAFLMMENQWYFKVLLNMQTNIPSENTEFQAAALIDEIGNFLVEQLYETKALTTDVEIPTDKGRYQLFDESIYHDAKSNAEEEKKDDEDVFYDAESEIREAPANFIPVSAEVFDDVPQLAQKLLDTQVSTSERTWASWIKRAVFKTLATFAAIILKIAIKLAEFLWDKIGTWIWNVSTQRWEIWGVIFLGLLGNAYYPGIVILLNRIVKDNPKASLSALRSGIAVCKPMFSPFFPQCFDTLEKAVDEIVVQKVVEKVSGNENEWGFESLFDHLPTSVDKLLSWDLWKNFPWKRVTPSILFSCAAIPLAYRVGAISAMYTLPWVNSKFPQMKTWAKKLFGQKVNLVVPEKIPPVKTKASTDDVPKPPTKRMTMADYLKAGGYVLLQPSPSQYKAPPQVTIPSPITLKPSNSFAAYLAERGYQPAKIRT